MSLRHDCLRCLGYVIMRSQLTFWHTPLAPLLIGANQYFYLLRHILSLGCDVGEFVLTHLKEVVFVIFLGRWVELWFLRWAHCPEAVRFRSGLTARVEDLPSITRKLWPTLVHFRFHWAAQGRPGGWRI